MNDNLLTIIGAMIGAAAMITVGLVAWAASRANPGTAAELMAQLQNRIKVLEDRQILLEEKLTAAEERARAAEHYARVFQSRPDNALPMSRFVADGWLHVRHRHIADRHGVQVGIFLDEDGLFALGHQVRPVEMARAEGALPSIDLLDLLEERIAEVAAQVRADAGFPPWVPRLD